MDARPFVADMCAGGNGNMALALTLVKTLAVVLCVSKLCTHTRNSVVVSKGIMKRLTFFAYGPVWLALAIAFLQVFLLQVYIKKSKISVF